MAAIGVLLVEDDDATRRRLERAIVASPACTVIAAVGDVAGARRALGQRGIEVLVVDLRLPDGDGVELIAEAGHMSPPIQSLVITALADRATVVQSLRAGASGYLLKDAHPLDVEQAIKDVHAGGAPLSPDIAHYLLVELGYGPGKVGRREVKLPPRELEVLRLISRGFSYDEIAALLSISTHTVKTYLKRTYRKLEVNSRTAAVFEARQLGILSPRE